MIIVSHSQMRCYKECRKKYFFSYVERLKPVITPEVLLTGSTYHAKLAQIIKTGAFEETGDKTDIMAKAWQKYVLPKLGLSKDVERHFEIRLAEDVMLIGYVDAQTADGIDIEHKSSGYPIDDKYIHNLSWDDQIGTYMVASGAGAMYYTVCQKPSIRQKMNETEEEYFARCVDWYAVDTETKVNCFKVFRTKEDIEEHRLEIIELAHEMAACKDFYRNPSACMIMGCDYRNICLNYDPKFVIGFEKKPEGRRRPDDEVV